MFDPAAVVKELSRMMIPPLVIDEVVSALPAAL
jgi:hypothetical protein